MFVAGRMAQMYTLEHSVWHTEMPPRRIPMRQVQFNLEYLTARGSIQKGNPKTLAHLFFFQVIKHIPFFTNLLFP